jgi:hypothetical protein
VVEAGTVEMAEDNLFPIFHSYWNLVRQGKAKPILCPTCNYEVVVSHFNSELRLACYPCNTSTTPGLNLIENVKAVVKEHIL